MAIFVSYLAILPLFYLGQWRYLWGMAKEDRLSISIVKLGSPRKLKEGLRLGTVRRPPRGVPKSEFAKRNFYDVWLPQLSPSAGLFSEGKSAVTVKEWSAFQRKFRAEMAKPDSTRLLDFLAALSHQTHFSLGCYCENDGRCHRSVLRQLLSERLADIDGKVLKHEKGQDG